MNAIRSRLSEPSSWAGVGLLLSGISQMFDVAEVSNVATAVTQAGEAVSAGADPVSAAVMTLAGIVAMFLKEGSAT